MSAIDPDLEDQAWTWVGIANGGSGAWGWASWHWTAYSNHMTDFSQVAGVDAGGDGQTASLPGQNKHPLCWASISFHFPCLLEKTAVAPVSFFKVLAVASHRCSRGCSSPEQTWPSLPSRKLVQNPTASIQLPVKE